MGKALGPGLPTALLWSWPKGYESEVVLIPLIMGLSGHQAVLSGPYGKADLEASGLLFSVQWSCESGMFLSALDEGRIAKGRRKVTALVSYATLG